MKMSVWKYSWAQFACLSLWPILLCAQSSDFAQNLADCKNGVETCDRSKLSESQLTDVALAAHRRNVSDCRNGYDACDHSKLSEPEAVALAVADHQKNVSNCTIGLGSCDLSRLTPFEAREWNVVQHRRNLADCQDGYDACDRDNYTFAQVGYEGKPTGALYVLSVEPRTRNKFLYRGRIWVDAEDFAVVRLEGEPAKNPSLWTKDTRIEQAYAKVNDFWFPASNRSTTSIRLGGRAYLTIECKDYQTTAAPSVKDSNSTVAGYR